MATGEVKDNLKIKRENTKTGVTDFPYDTFDSCQSRPDSASSIRKQMQETELCMELLPPEATKEGVAKSECVYTVDISPGRKKSALCNRSRSDNLISRKTPPPSKQISLTAVKRKEDIADSAFITEPDWSLVTDTTCHAHLTNRQSTYHNTDSIMSSKGDKSGKKYSVETKSIRSENDPHTVYTNGNTSSSDRPVEPVTCTDLSSQQKGKDEKLKAGADDESDEEEEEQEIKAPNELMMEFLACVMEKDYQNADKLCKMILMYEPENKEAGKFQPLITEKLKIEEEKANNPDNTGTDESADEDDDDSGDDSGSDDSDDDSDDESGEDENDGARVVDEDDVDSDDNRTDSGIASTASE